MRRHLLRVTEGARVGLSPAGTQLATGIGAALASLFTSSPRLKSALADTAIRCFRSAAEELRREREERERRALL
jgi:hypothetical protein